MTHVHPNGADFIWTVDGGNADSITLARLHASTLPWIMVCTLPGTARSCSDMETLVEKGGIPAALGAADHACESLRAEPVPLKCCRARHDRPAAVLDERSLP